MGSAEMSKSEDLRSLVRRYYDRVDDGDLVGLLELFDEEVIYRRPGYEPILGTAALAAFYESERLIDRGRHTLHAVIVESGEVAVRGEFEGFLKTGVQVQVGFADFFRVLQSRIVERNTYFDSPAV